MKDDVISRKSAIDLLDNLIGMVDDNHGSDYDAALRMGIEALKAEESEYTIEMQESDIDEAMKLVRDARETILLSAEPVRCKDCRWGREVCGNIECSVDSNMPPEYHGYEWFCPNGERK